MRFLDRESLRVVLLNTKQHLITVCTVSQGSVNESLAHPREVFKPPIVIAAYSFIMVHNHPSGDPAPSEADMRLTRRILEASRILQLQLLDHVIIGAPAPDRINFSRICSSVFDTSELGKNHSHWASLVFRELSRLIDFVHIQRSIAVNRRMLRVAR